MAMTQGAQKLTQYRRTTRMTYNELGQKLSASAMTVFYWCNGKKIPSEDNKRKIQTLLANKVKYSDWGVLIELTEQEK